MSVPADLAAAKVSARLCIWAMSTASTTAVTPLYGRKLPHSSNNRLNDLRENATSSSNDSASLPENKGIQSETLKIVVFGSACSGKTSIIKQFIGNGQDFSEQYDPTERRSNYFKTVLSFDTNAQKITHWALKIVGKSNKLSSK